MKYLAIIAIISLILISGCSQEQTTQLANPASVFCEEQGGSLNFVESPEGTRGYCYLPSGDVCEEWSFFRGTCPPDEKPSAVGKRYVNSNPDECRTILFSCTDDEAPFFDEQGCGCMPEEGFVEEE